MDFRDLPEWLNRENVSIAFLGLASFGVAIAFLVAQSRNSLIRVTDVLTGDNGRLASNKTFQALAFLLSAWAMVFLTITGKADAIVWGAWVAVWAGATLTNKVVNNAAVAKAQEAAAATGTSAPPPVPQVSDKN